MKRIPIKKRLTSKRGIFASFKWRASVFLALMLFIGVGFFAYQRHLHPRHHTSLMSQKVAHVKAWFAERKSYWHQHRPPVKTVLAAKTDDEEKPVHFEFYTTLPAMQVNVTSPTSGSSSASVQKETVSRVAAVEMETIKAASPTVKSPLIQPEELEKELSNELKQDNYIVQLGLFHTAAYAEHYRSLAAKAGFSATVIELNDEDKLSFRVQLGPFANKDEAKIAGRQLQKKGFNGVVRKIELS